MDNAFVELADTRLTAFRSNSSWAVFFEVVGWSQKELAFVNDVYAYGTCIYPGGFLANSNYVISAPKDRPILDPETNDCIASWDEWSVIVGDKVQLFRPSREEYRQAGIDIRSAPGPGSLREADILRFLVYKLGHIFFEPDSRLLSRTPACKGLTKLIQTSEWAHPDVLSGELPSHNEAIKTLVNALISGNPKQFLPGKSNTFWKNWLRA